MKNRYEEYQSFEDNIPFVLIQNIKRSGAERSTQANWHENPEVEYCHKGEGRVLIDGRGYSLREGELAIVDCGSIHHTGSESGMEYSCIIIDTEFCRESGIDVRRLRFQGIIKDDAAAELFLRICRTYNDSDDRMRIPKLRQYALELLILLCESYCREECEEKVRGQNKNAKRAMDYIRSRYAEKITLDGMARELYINKFVLSRQFKSSVGMSVFEYINSCRCNAAAMLIAEGESVNAAARACGFENMSFFTRTFKRFMGKLPSEYKK